MNNSKIAKEADSLAKSLAELPTEERKKLEDIITALKLMWIGGSGGVVSWKTVETVTGEFVLALCKV